IFRMDYETFEQAVMRARRAQGLGASTIYDIVSGSQPALGEAEFVDAVSRNLARGRAVIAVVGDGIREDIAPLAELLQSHAGQRFTFALVELAVYQGGSNGVRIVVPSVLAKTVLIERGVVRIDDSGVRIDPRPRPFVMSWAAPPGGPSASLRMSSTRSWDFAIRTPPGSCVAFSRRWIGLASTWIGRPV